MFSAPVVLNTFTTRALRAHRATCSAPESAWPWVSVMPGPIGLVASRSGLPAKSPAAWSAASAAFHGVARITTSARATASRTVVTSALACARASRSAPCGSRTP